jgi:hypothetical protein
VPAVLLVQWTEKPPAATTALAGSVPAMGRWREAAPRRQGVSQVTLWPASTVTRLVSPGQVTRGVNTPAAPAWRTVTATVPLYLASPLVGAVTCRQAGRQAGRCLGQGRRPWLGGLTAVGWAVPWLGWPSLQQMRRLAPAAAVTAVHACASDPAGLCELVLLCCPCTQCAAMKPSTPEGFGQLRRCRKRLGGGAAGGQALAVTMPRICLPKGLPGVLVTAVSKFRVPPRR